MAQYDLNDSYLHWRGFWFGHRQHNKLIPLALIYLTASAVIFLSLLIHFSHLAAAENLVGFGL